MTLIIQELNFSYNDKPLLRDLSFTLAPHTHAAIIGPSGCGKTSLLQLILGSLQPTSGTITFEGCPITSRRHPAMAIIFQHGGLFPWKTLRENIELGAQCHKQTDPHLLAHLITIMQLAPLLDQYPHQLSGGEIQRGAIARALMLKPRLLLLDEAFSALDTTSKKSLIALLQELAALFGFASLLVTHNPDEVSAYAAYEICLAP